MAGMMLIFKKRLSANLAISDDLQSSYDGFIKQIEKKTEENELAMQDLEIINSDLRDNAREQEKGLVSIYNGEDALDLSSYTVERQEKLRDILSEYELDYTYAQNTQDTGGTATFIIPGLHDVIKDHPDFLEHLNNEMNDFIGDAIYEEGKNLNAKRLERE